MYSRCGHIDGPGIFRCRISMSFHLRLCAGEFVILISETTLVTADLVLLASKQQIYTIEDCGSFHGRPGQLWQKDRGWKSLHAEQQKHRPQCKCRVSDMV